MASLMSAIGGAALTVGALSAVRFLLTLTTGPAWRKLRVFARATPATTPAARRGAMIWFCSSMFLALNGTLLLLNVQDEVARWLASGVLTALVIAQLGLMLVSRRQRESAG
jgi:hypothetical protein